MKKMISILLTVCLLLTGCTAGVPTQTPENSTAVTQSTPQESTPAPEQTNGAESAATDSAEVPADPTAPADAFDTSAVTAVAVTDGIQYTFAALPQTAADITALLEVLPRTDAHNVAALFHTALVRYINSPADGTAMIDVLRGPQPMSDTDKDFMKERFSDKKYLPRAYFEGAEPGNEYQPAEPWTLIIYDDPVAPPEGYHYVNVTTAGADSPRRIVTRLKDGEHYLWEYNGTLLSIRLPASEDPWA